MPYTDYPESATNNAKRALAYRDESGNPKGCGTPVGWARANQLAKREAISEDTVKRMASFNRHRQHKDVPYTEGCGGLMWDAWGGTSGIDWAIRKSKEIDNMHNDNKRKFLNYWVGENSDIINMSIMGDIGWDWQASEFINILSEYKDKTFRANIYSPGGDVIDALAVYDFIKANGIDFQAYIYGWAASAATVIACAANLVAIGENSRYMIHNVTEGGQETPEARAFTETLIDIYKAKTGKDKRWIREKMNNETFFTAKEARDEGFVDKIVSAKSLAAFLDNNFSNQNYKDMADNSLLKRLAAKLGLAGDTDELTEANVTEALENDSISFAAKADMEALEAKVNTMAEANQAQDNADMLTLLETMTEAIEANKQALKDIETKFANKVQEAQEAQEGKIAELATKLNAIKVEAFKGEQPKPDASGHGNEADRQKAEFQLDAKSMIDRIKNRK